MARNDKLYLQLDELIAEFRQLLIREFQKAEGIETQSLYLQKRKGSEESGGRVDTVRSKVGNMDEANEVLEMEKRIIALCNKLKEPLPVELEIVGEFVSECAKVADRPRWKLNPNEIRGVERSLKQKALDQLTAI